MKSRNLIYLLLVPVLSALILGGSKMSAEPSKPKGDLEDLIKLVGENNRIGFIRIHDGTDIEQDYASDGDGGNISVTYNAVGEAPGTDPGDAIYEVQYSDARFAHAPSSDEAEMLARLAPDERAVVYDKSNSRYFLLYFNRGTNDIELIARYKIGSDAEVGFSNAKFMGYYVPNVDGKLVFVPSPDNDESPSEREESGPRL